MEMTKVVKPFIRRGWPNTFGNIVYVLRPNVPTYTTALKYVLLRFGEEKVHTFECVVEE